MTISLSIAAIPKKPFQGFLYIFIPQTKRKWFITGVTTVNITEAIALDCELWTPAEQR